MKKTTVRILSLFMILTFISSFAVSGAGAFRGPVSADSVSPDGFMDYSQAQPDAVNSFDRDGFKAYLLREFKKCNTYIDIESYGLQYTQSNEDLIAQIIWYEIPDAFHVVRLSLWHNTETYMAVAVIYNCSVTEYTQKSAQIQANSAYLLRGLDSQTLSDAEKAIILHDRLAVWCEYDKSTEIPDSSRHIDGVLINQVAVCTGYALAYDFLMDKLGIESEFLSSKTLNHAWNIVTINGKRYHMDVTWDDKTYDVYGRVYHDYCLRSTDYFQNHNHTATDYDSSPTDTTYDGLNYWDDSLTEIQYFNGSVYYLDGVNSKICRRENGQSVNVCDVFTQWGYRTDLGNGRYSVSYSRLSSDDYYLYYSSPDAIKRVNITDGTATNAYIPVLPGSGFKIYGFKAESDTFYIDVNQLPTLEANSRTNYSQQFTYANNYAVTYNANGGSATISPQKKRTDVDIRLSSTIPVKTGFVFLGWASSPDAETPQYQPGDLYTANESICLYAVWHAGEYTVVFNANSGTCAESSRQVTFGTAYGTLPVPEMTGYSFNGWYTSLTGGDKVYAQDNYLIPGNSVLFAHWTPLNVIIYFDANQGECSTESITVKYDSTCTLPQPARNGYSFRGWYDADNVQFTSSTPVKVLNSLHLHAVWDRNIYTLFFNPGEGKCTTQSKAMYYGDSYGSLPVPTRADYDFKGWYDAAEGGNQVSADTVMGCSGNVTIYAHWEIKHYILSFDGQNGNQYENISVAYKSAPVLPSPSRSGYIFLGWYIDGNKFDQGSSYTFRADKTAVAQWHKVSLITIDSNPGSVTVDKMTNVHLTCSVSLSEGESIVWKDGNNHTLSNSKECIIENIRSTTKVRAIVVYNGMELNYDEEEIIVETNFIKVIIAYIKYFFGILPDYKQ